MNPSEGPTTRPAGRLRFTATGLAGEGETPLMAVATFADSLLRGIGQVLLQDNSYSGLLFLLGIFYNSSRFGVAALVGCTASTLAALLLGAQRSQVRSGLFGFNGALVGIALLYFLAPGPLAWGYVVVAAACTTVVMAALMHLLAAWKAPALTAPFVVVTLCFILATARFGRLHSTDLLPTAGLPQAASVEGVVTGGTVIEGLFQGVGQVFFQGNSVTGAFFVAGLLLSSPAATMAALLGSLLGLLVAWGMGAAEPAIRAGAFGFNSVLTAVALGSGRYLADRAAVAYVALAAVATAVVFAAVSAALQPLGMPALTLPFVLVVWAFTFAEPLFRRVRPASAG